MYEAPPPKNKRNFLRKIEAQPIGFGHVLLIQFSFVSGGSWLVSLIALGGIVYLNRFYEKWFLGAVLALMPFLAVAAAVESVRSTIYGMDELERTARFSLKSILLARMGIVGVENMLLAIIAALFAGGDFLQTMLYILTPYLMTACGSFYLVRHISGWEGIYSCAGLAFAVCLLTLLSRRIYGWLYQEQYTVWWMIAVIVLLCLMFTESRRVVRAVFGNGDAVGGGMEI